MKWFIAFAFLLLAAGTVLVIHASSLPIYTDPEAPERLSQELDKLPKEQKFPAWYAQLKTFETPHKHLSDCGRGMIATGIGLGLAIALLFVYRKYPGLRHTWILFLFWLTLWAIRVPLTFWYYQLREDRFDYPTWGDSLAIPVVSEIIAWVIGAIISSILLKILLIRRSLPVRLEIVKPRSSLDWTRSLFLGLWFLLNVFLVATGINDGDEGLTLTCTVSEAVLVICLCAPKAERTSPPILAK